MPDILPISASQLQRDLDKSSGPSQQSIQTVEKIPGIKFNPPEQMLPWLIWEYGLTPLLPYINEPQQAIQEGVQWQRIRGTPDSLALAFGWLGLKDIAIEPEVPGRHFYQYQVATGRVVSDTELENVKAVSQFSAPLRSRLARLYHGYDVRRLRLDESDYGALLSDYSGVRKSGVVLSFGRTHQPLLPVTDITVTAVRHAKHRAYTRDVYWPALDNEVIGGLISVSNRRNHWRSLLTWNNYNQQLTQYHHRDLLFSLGNTIHEQRRQAQFRLTLPSDSAFAEALDPAMRVIERPRSMRGITQLWQGFWDYRIWSKTNTAHIAVKHLSYYVNEHKLTLSGFEPNVLDLMFRHFSLQLNEQFAASEHMDVGRIPTYGIGYQVPMEQSAYTARYSMHLASIQDYPEPWRGYWDTRNWNLGREILVRAKPQQR